MAKRWSKTELSYLKRHAESASLEEMAAKVHSDTETVRQKLAELGLVAGAGPADDPALETFEKGLEAFHKGDLEAAGKLFADVAEEADEAQLADRGRQYLAVCRHRLAEDAETDPYLRAVFEKNRGNVDAARELVRKHGSDDDERYVYLDASLASLADEPDAAVEKLRAAIALEPQNKVHAYHDPDFASLRGREEFQGLFGAS